MLVRATSARQRLEARVAEPGGLTAVELRSGSSSGHAAAAAMILTRRWFRLKS